MAESAASEAVPAGYPPGQRRILAEHVRMVVEAGRRTIAEPADLAALELQAPKALAFAAEAHLRAAVSR